MAIEIKVPEVGESVSEVQIGAWHFGEGERVEVDKAVVSVETDKVTVEVLSPATGRLSSILKAKGTSAAVGEVIGVIEVLAEIIAPNQAQSVVDTAHAPLPDARAERHIDSPINAVGVSKLAGAGETRTERSSSTDAETSEASGAAAWASPSARRALAAQHRQTFSEAARQNGEGGESVRGAGHAGHAKPEAVGVVNPHLAGDDEEVVPMSPFRLTAAERLLHAQESAALLTTFNEIDMSLVQQVRKEYQSAFQEKHGIKLGLMSFFVRAAVEALKAVPVVNAEVRGKNIVYKKHYDIGVAIGGGRGLIVPVLRHAETMGFAAVERAISDFGARARDNKITLNELLGGTFTISNGGVYGSMLSTPIVNSPQSAILGLHAISDRPVARDGQVVIRPMMYVALTYDHRIIDGREAVTFLRKVKEYVEQPTRLLLEL